MIWCDAIPISHFTIFWIQINIKCFSFIRRTKFLVGSKTIQMTGLAVWSFPFLFCWSPNNGNFIWVRKEFPDEGDGWSDADGAVVDERRACNPSVTDFWRPCVLRYKDVVPPERVLSNSSHTILLIFSVAESFSLLLLNKINKQNSNWFFRSYVFFFSRLIHTKKNLNCVTAFN